ncbi:MAG TPA: NYN domain-containing protein [Candidatus Saccharibacteria bacterium]|nr:NYN domain-containing protein [Candidatus Saccharibacteria bacterium]
MAKFLFRRPKPTGNFAFIDSQNLNLGTQKAGFKLDWHKFRQLLKDKYGVTRAYLFIGYMQEHEDMYKQLHDQGYLIVLKPTVTINMTSEEVQAHKLNEEHLVKGNVDAELVLYAMKELSNYKKAIIVSGDGDFYCLAEYLEKKERLECIMTPNWQYSSLLKPYEKYITRIDQMRRQLEYKNYSRNSKNNNNRNNKQKTRR